MSNHISDSIIHAQRTFFAQGTTKDITFRVQQLYALKKAIIAHEQEIVTALKNDLNKSEFESYLTEIHICLQEINHTLANIRQWSRTRKVRTPWTLFAASSYLAQEPRGVVFIIAPWNYPFQLLIMPLIGAIAAGNCVILKPSEHAPHTAATVEKIMKTIFDPAYITCVQGGIAETESLLNHCYDYIFFTGSTRVGKIIMQAAARHLTPMTLELGGKCPCLVDHTADLDCAARRIAWGKFLNAGQVCISPDYLLVDANIKTELIAKIQECITKFYGNNPEQSPDYARIISKEHVDRLATLMHDGIVVAGGQINREQKYIAPTVIDNITTTSACMQEEIFGPILPIITYEKNEEALALINNMQKPLALYCFSNDKKFQQHITASTSSGGICFNDVVLHIGSPNLPFGGVGASGFGAYHGKASFDTFSHTKAIMHHGCWADIPGRYPPYAKKSTLWIKKFLLFWEKN